MLKLDGVRFENFSREKQEQCPFGSEPDFGVASINYSLDELLARAVAPDAGMTD